MDPQPTAFSEALVSSIALSQPISASFEPQPDITAYELARLLPYLSSRMPLYEGGWEALGSANRHLRRYDRPAA